MTNNVKKCTKCEETKDVSEFGKNSQIRNGINYICKVCACTNSKAYRAANLEKVDARLVAWRANNKEKIKTYSKAYRAANHDEVKQSYASWVAANPNRNKERRAAWAAANPEKLRLNNNNRRARKRNAEGTHTAADVKHLFTLQKGKCACCKDSIKDGYHVDHIMPLARDGRNDWHNLQLLCPTCNLQKNAKHPVDFMQQRGFLL